MARYSAYTLNDSSGVDNMIPDIVVPEITETAARTEVFMQTVRRFDFTGPGEIFTVPTAGALSFGALGSASYIDGTSPTETAFNTGGRTFTPTFRFLDVVIGIDALKDSNMSVQDAIISEVGIGLAADRDSRFGAIYTEAPATTTAGGMHEIGTDGTALSYSDVVNATKKLYIVNAPRPFSGIIHPTQWGELMADNTVIDAATAGQPGLTLEQQDNGYVCKLFDASIYISDQLTESSGLHSMWYSTGRALGYAYKMLQSPTSGGLAELMVDIDWNSAKRMYEINCTYQSAVGGLKGTSATTNTWMVDLIS